MLLTLLPQVLAGDAQDLRGPLYVAASLLERESDILALRVGEREALGHLERLAAPSGRAGVAGLERAERRQIGPLESGPVGEERRALDRLDLLLELLVEQLTEVIGEQGDVALDVAQRRQRCAGDTDAVEEIRSEPAGLHELLEIAVGGRDQAQGHLQLLRAAQPPKPPTLEHVEQLRLQFGSELRDLVEKQCAAVRHLDEAALRFTGVGEGSPLVAEQLGLEQAWGKRRAVDLHEPSYRMRARVVNGAGDQVFARAAVAEQQHGRAWDGRHLADECAHPLGLGMPAEDCLDRVLPAAGLLEGPFLKQ